MYGVKYKIKSILLFVWLQIILYSWSWDKLSYFIVFHLTLTPDLVRTPNVRILINTYKEIGVLHKFLRLMNSLNKSRVKLPNDLLHMG